MDEKLINGYINNLAQKVQELQMENILLKTRIGILEQPKEEEVKEEPKKKSDYKG
tara:strand:+ start:646 stop:810 length:165 start_codon:yes stop_codon:yes gene_type:complete